MEIPKTRTKFDAREHCEFTESDGVWTCYWPLLELTGTGETQEEAFQAMAELANEKLTADEELQKTFIAFRDEHSVEEEIPEDERTEIKSVVDRSYAASKGFRAVTAADFDDAIGSQTPTLVDFWADWCMPCHMLAPVLKEVADDLGDLMQVVKLNVDEHHSVPERLGVQGFPTMILFKGGEELHRVVGAGRDVAALRAELEPHL